MVNIMIMKKHIAFLLIFLAFISIVLTSCGGNDGNDLKGVITSIEPPVRILAKISAQDFETQAEICFFEATADISMTTVFNGNDTLSGLRIERHKDGKLYASYDGLLSELDQSALNIVAVTNDVLQAVRDRLATDGIKAVPEDDKFAQAEIEIDGKKIVIYYDEKTNTVLRIKSNIFDTPVVIDFIQYEKITSSAVSR